jgi:hypothetical protein
MNRSERRSRARIRGSKAAADAKRWREESDQRLRIIAAIIERAGGRMVLPRKALVAAPRAPIKVEWEDAGDLMVLSFDVVGELVRDDA